ncbi:elongation factor Ts [candidate division WOR-1 bacterium RIFOXYA12_FULL_43_27]|uniref:Elongation factor Ts n=1 Tax=candidate division WOR-1 bacterium RIFOXYC2_FULL_46_14 TaxID=1802587 RepID=A0A1F4U5J3_UNCSA|nr:MAG: elongation factor Ts [candidate division WOR-1 bacterium RIFOXYA12_FULL_43_27]OGC20325.1 MAG: elongation factor Ts [candidate division WOR-1 bacterium RIFOXYB2_FULL_46_45]OGC31938.1 MAG: elongation factor Ts [candidate division WOR-1 bacterium RIFOXYA2_FULL_46_56]OGC40171.1 MAG: elongation factor Ts [candidate division WOR-1 bacterium RIFOXYC2_FULL_46_14]
MTTITSKIVQELREKTGCGMMDCKKALTETNGDMEAAADLLRKKGLAGVAKRSGRVAAQGQVASYIHTGGKIGVLVEVNCETDFVAKNDDFQAFVKDVAMQIAAQNPEYITREDVPEGVVQHEKNILIHQAKEEGKPEKALEKIIEGRVKKFYEEVCLLEQPFIKDTKKTINDLLGEIAAKIGENIVIRRFIRYQLGEKS